MNNACVHYTYIKTPYLQLIIKLPILNSLKNRPFSISLITITLYYTLLNLDLNSSGMYKMYVAMIVSNLQVQ